MTDETRVGPCDPCPRCSLPLAATTIETPDVGVIYGPVGCPACFWSAPAVTFPPGKPADVTVVGDGTPPSLVEMFRDAGLTVAHVPAPTPEAPASPYAPKDRTPAEHVDAFLAAASTPHTRAVADEIQRLRTEVAARAVTLESVAARREKHMGARWTVLDLIAKDAAKATAPGSDWFAADSALKRIAEAVTQYKAALGQPEPMQYAAALYDLDGAFDALEKEQARAVELEGKLAGAERYLELNRDIVLDVRRIVLGDADGNVVAAVEGLRARADELLAANVRFEEGGRAARRELHEARAVNAIITRQMVTLMEALEFYADEEHYDASIDADASPPESIVLNDHGTTAEQALQDVMGESRPKRETSS